MKPLNYTNSKCFYDTCSKNDTIHDIIYVLYQSAGDLPTISMLLWLGGYICYYLTDYISMSCPHLPTSFPQ